MWRESGLGAVADLGAVFTKAVSLKPRGGNPAPRLAETAAGMINSIGLQNPGVEGFVGEHAPELESMRASYFVNVVGESEADFVGVVAALDDSGYEGFLGYEINVSCPNVAGGMDFGQDESALGDLVRAIRKATKRIVVVKLSPNVTDVAVFAKIAEAAGADALTVANTFVGMTIDLNTRTSRIGTDTGGLSGPAIRPITLALVHECRKAVGLPIFASGGIVTTNDALEYIIAGACAFQLGTGLYLDPAAPFNVAKGIEEYLSVRGISSLMDLVGTYKPR